MNYRFFLFGASVAVSLLFGCAPTTTVYNPDTTTTNIRDTGTVSSEELHQAAVSMIKSALTDSRVTSFLEKYKVEMKNPKALPVLKLEHVINETFDNDLKVDELTDALFAALHRSGLVYVTLVEGADKSKVAAASRELENDDNFDQSTVMKRGTLVAARIVVRPKVITNKATDGNRTAYVNTFTVKMYDLKDGLLIWEDSKRLGFIKNKSTFGW